MEIATKKGAETETGRETVAVAVAGTGAGTCAEGHLD